ncbi:MAG: hypothetical protein KC444_10295 [Nitrosopumilus sp.]|nr:hypothetical protein [Nitrosopumilus sp.]
MNKLDVAVRAYALVGEETRNKIIPPAKKKSFDRVLVLDNETTTDLHQNLTFGYFEIYQNKVLEHCGLYYDSKIVKPNQISILKSHAENLQITIYTIEQFREIFLTEVYDLESLCVGFNLPFDVTRIAIRSSVARVKKKEAFSLLLSQNLHYPRLYLTHQTSTLSFIQWANPKSKSKKFKGNFVDLRTLAHALTDKKHTLESACHAFKTKLKKSKAKEHGKISPDYINYCINDVKSTYYLFLAAQKEFDSYQLDIPITKAYTPATIGKQFLRKMRVRSFLEKNPDFSPEMIGKIMTCYYGGRTECKIRKTPVMCDLLDFLSMYPTVCILQELWKFVISDKIVCRDSTLEIQKLVECFRIHDIQDKKMWKRFPCIVQIIPDNDILPVRSKFGQKYAWNIGICNVSGTEPMWYSLADIIASKLLSGKCPKILKAISFEPAGCQKDLKTISIQGLEVDPYSKDLYKNLIESRQKIKEKRDSFEKSSQDYTEYDRKQQIIKIITNAISYGIFVEINTFSEKEKTPVKVYGLSSFEDKKLKTEKTGFMFNPIIAVAITSAARLLLATAESLLARHGTTHAYCDTDSMMIPPQYTEEIKEFFQPLNPYDFDADLFKVEKSHKWFYGISAKRYCLYDVADGKTVIDGDKYSAHGLGHLLDPFRSDADEKSEWHKQIWQDILDLHYGKTTEEQLFSKYDGKYAIQQLSISTPTILSRFKIMNREKDYHSQIKPSNFALVGFPNSTNPETGKQIKPFAPYQNPAKHAVYERFVDYNDPEQGELQGIRYWRSLWNTIEEYLRHPESKFDGDIGVLRRKHVDVGNVIHIGKESNGLEESELFGLDQSSYETYQNESAIDESFRKLVPKILGLKPKDVKESGISKQTLWNIKQKIRTGHLNRIMTDSKIRILSSMTQT